MTVNALIALAIFVTTFYFIVSGKVDRSIASFAGALVMVVTGVTLGFYSQEEAFRAIDFNMMGLLAGMMVIVGVCKKTGIFSYLAVRAAKASGGSPLRLMIMMGLITAFLSMLLDNVTTIILVIPITVLICDILGISPLAIIVTEIALSNIGGVGTMVGDPPNMMIASAADFTFNDFLVHLMPIVIAAMAVSILTLTVIFRKDVLVKPRDFGPIMDIDEKAAIRDSKGLKRTVFSLTVVFVLFFLQKMLGWHHSFIALIGAGIVLALVRPDIGEVLSEIEWPIFVFFGSLFILVGGLEKTGLLTIVAEKIASLANVNYLMAKFSILWASAGFASLVDRVPFTTAMIPIIEHMGKTGLNIEPLWWILALGVGFGGNGTPIGSIVGVVGLSMSEKTQSPIDFKIWLKTATVVMLITVIFVSLLIFIT